MSVYVHQFHVCSEAGSVVIHYTLATSQCCLEKKKKKEEMRQNEMQMILQAGTPVSESKILICYKPFFSPVQWIKHLKWLAFVTTANGELCHLESC